MLAARPVTFKTPHAKRKNENEFSTLNNFPKTPLPPVKQLLETGPSGKQTAQTAAKSRRALGDKTPGVHLQNRGVKAINAGPEGKTLIFIDQKPPSASRKSVKQPRTSEGLKTPGPATSKPQWNVGNGDFVEELAQLSLKEEEDFDEPEYMPPTARASLPDHDFPSGGEVGRILMEMAKTSRFDYNMPPPSFEEVEAFLIPEDQLVVPLSFISPEPIPFVEDEYPYEDITNLQMNAEDQKVMKDAAPVGRITRSQTLSQRVQQSRGNKGSSRMSIGPTAKPQLFSHRVQNQGARTRATSRRLSARGSQAVHSPSKKEFSSLDDDTSAKVDPSLLKVFEDANIPLEDVRFDV